MNTECTPVAMGFQGLDRREVIGKLDGGQISSDGGGVLLREIEKRTEIVNRLELTPEDANEKSRYKKIVANPSAMDDLLVDVFLESYERPPAEIVLDVDATDDPLHGNQEGRFFHGYYGHYCYLPLYIFCGEQLLCARLRTADAWV